MRIRFQSNPIILSEHVVDENWISVRDELNSPVPIQSFEAPNSIYIDNSYAGQILTITQSPTTLFDISDYDSSVQKLIAIYNENISRERGTSFYQNVEAEKPAARDALGLPQGFQTVECNFLLSRHTEFSNITERISYLTEYNPPGKVIVSDSVIGTIYIASHTFRDIKLLSEGGEVVSPYLGFHFFHSVILTFATRNRGHRFLPMQEI